ncbi:MAG: prepilin peptidase [Chloroflexi bacterium]|nr:prepilin peptidase [Chloroflexota bacterium]
MEIVFAFIFGGLAGFLIHRAADALYRRNALPVPTVQWRARAIELAGAFALAFLWFRFGASARFVFSVIYSTVFLLVLVTDFEYRYIFDVVILPAMLFAALASPLSSLGGARSLLGGAVAFAIVFLIYILAPIYARVRHREIDSPFGFGDVKLAGFMGIVVGFPSALNAIVLAILLGGIGAILFLAIQFARTRRIALDAAIPYGPFFCVAGFVYMVL